jgi:hypothetical protein
MLQRFVRRSFSKIHGIRSLAKLEHMKQAKLYKRMFLKDPANTTNFIEYLKVTQI